MTEFTVGTTLSLTLVGTPDGVFWKAETTTVDGVRLEAFARAEPEDGKDPGRERAAGFLYRLLGEHLVRRGAVSAQMTKAPSAP